MGQGDVPTSRGGPLRRRKEKRQLEHLAASTSREGTPRTSAAHVKVLGDEQAANADRDRDEERHALARVEPDGTNADAPEPRPSGFHVHAVPIDQPVGDRSD
jgi:hypothetical protein